MGAPSIGDRAIVDPSETRSQDRRRMGGKKNVLPNKPVPNTTPPMARFPALTRGRGGGTFRVCGGDTGRGLLWRYSRWRIWLSPSFGCLRFGLSEEWSFLAWP